MPLFMIGTQRSGSNLLRLMLNQLPEIAAPHPPHILQRLMPMLPGYGDLSVDANFTRLVDDTCKLVELNPVPWEGVRLDRADIARRCRARSLVAVFGAVYDALAETWGKSGWCCKSLANIQYLDDIERYYQNEAKYIYLYRDGRDVAVSFSKAVVGEKHFYHIASEWGATQRIALALRRQIGTQRFFSLRYEDITTQPEQAMQSLCEFVGAAYSPSMLDFHETSEARKAAGSSELWGNVAQPLMRDNSRKFVREASADDVRIFELVAGDVLDILGYGRLYTRRGERGQFGVADLRQFELRNKERKQEVLRTTDPGDLQRRNQQEGLLKEIRERHQARNESWISL